MSNQGDIRESFTIFFVSDEMRSAAFYGELLAQTPDIAEPGMTAFRIGQNSFLGLMSPNSIKRIIGSSNTIGREATEGTGWPAALHPAELYLVVDSVTTYSERARRAGACELSPCTERPWGDRVAYFSDPDGFVLAFAERRR